MKLLVIILASLFLVSAPAIAAPATPSSKLDDLKERLATKVAELRTTEKRAIFGSVKSKSLTTLVVETKTKDVKIELPDEMTVVQYLKGKRTTLSIDNVEKGDLVTVYGEFDTTLELLRATYILIQLVEPLRVSGTVEAIDRSDFSLTLKIPSGQTYTIDIEKTTKINRWDKVNKLTKSGFSKMVEGVTIHLVGTPVPKKENSLSALRILNLGNPVGEPPATPPPEESTSSATPKSTPKATQ